MFDFYQRRKLHGLLTSPLTRGLLISVFLLLSWAAITRYNIAAEMEARRLEAEEEVRQLREQKEALNEQVEYLSDDRGIEAEMRRQFDVALENEQVVVIVDSKETSDETNNTDTSYQESDEPAWYEFWR